MHAQKYKVSKTPRQRPTVIKSEPGIFDPGFFRPKLFKPDSPARYDDPNEPAPLSGTPLKGFNGFGPIEAEYQEGRPRLIDVNPRTGFGPLTDCSNLRTIDAILTILYNDDKGRFKFFHVPEIDQRIHPWEFFYDRKTGKEERLDMFITRAGSSIWFRLEEKLLLPNGSLRHDRYVQGMWAYKHDPIDGSWDYKTWGLVHLSGKPWDTRPILHAETDLQRFQRLEVNKDQDRRLARYLLLNRPWGDKEKVKVVVTIKHVSVLARTSEEPEDKVEQEEESEDDAMELCDKDGLFGEEPSELV